MKRLRVYADTSVYGGGDPVVRDKKFDCVNMKNDIQQKLLEEMERLSPEEWQERADARVLADPILGPFWKRVRKVRTSGLRPKS